MLAPFIFPTTPNSFHPVRIHNSKVRSGFDWGSAQSSTKTNKSWRDSDWEIHSSTGLFLPPVLMQTPEKSLMFLPLAGYCNANAGSTQKSHSTPGLVAAGCLEAAGLDVAFLCCLVSETLQGCKYFRTIYVQQACKKWLKRSKFHLI